MVDRFDAIIVGCGVSGGLAALELERSGRSVLLLDPRGAPSGPTSLPGGIAWRSSLAKLFPELARDAPRGRSIIERRMSLLSSEGAFSIDFRDLSWAANQDTGGWVVERSEWQTWALRAAPAARVQLWKDVPVESFNVDRAGKVTGLTAGGKSAEAPVTLLQDPGAIAIAERSGVRLGAPRAASSTSRETVVDVTHPLPAGRVDDRFGAGPRRGFSLEAVLGFLPKGAMGFGFVYPGASSVHTGVVVHDRSVAQAGLTPGGVAELFATHPAIVPFVRGAGASSTVMLPTPAASGPARKLYGDGLLVMGDAALAGGSSGVVLRGTDALLQSSYAAVRTVQESLEAKDSTSRLLSRYVVRLRSQGALTHLGRSDDRAARIKWNPRVHRAYPALFSALLRRMMTEKGQPKEHMRELLTEVLKASGVPYTALARDGLAAAGSL